jgi:hypothetical protein
LERRPDGQRQGQGEAGADKQMRVRLLFHVQLLSSFPFLFVAGAGLTACLKNRFNRDQHGHGFSFCSGGDDFAMG